MAIKKSEIYSSLDASCDKLRGGMDPSQYKNYILSLLFMKYVTVKFKGKPYPQVTVPEGGSFDDLKALRNQDNIGEGGDKAFTKLSEANDQLSGIFRNVHFNDYTKLGKGKEMVKKITDLIDIFCRPEFDLEKNRAGGDDLLGDTYEYLMRKFAVESGKSKGQFLTPAEASRVLAGVLGIADVKARSEGWSIYDPAYFYSCTGQLKVLFDRSVAIYPNLTNKQYYYLLAQGDENKDTFAGTIKSLDGFLDCCEGSTLKGMVAAPGIYEKGAVKGTKYLDQAYKLGLKVK